MILLKFLRNVHTSPMPKGPQGQLFWHDITRDLSLALNATGAHESRRLPDLGKRKLRSAQGSLSSALLLSVLAIK
jgi:hypothetical protein